MFRQSSQRRFTTKPLRCGAERPPGRVPGVGRASRSSTLLTGCKSNGPATAAGCWSGEGGRTRTQTVMNGLVRHARKLPQERYKSLTWDRGKELAGEAQRGYEQREKQ